MSYIEKMQFPRQDTGIGKTEIKVGIKVKLPKEVYPANRSKQRDPHIANSRSHIFKANLSSRWIFKDQAGLYFPFAPPPLVAFIHLLPSDF